MKSLPTLPPHTTFPLAGSGSSSRGQRQQHQQQQQTQLSYPIEDYVHPSTRSVHDLKASFAWNSMLGEKDFVAAPVQAFKHVSLQLKLSEAEAIIAHAKDTLFCKESFCP